MRNGVRDRKRLVSHAPPFALATELVIVANSMVHPYYGHMVICAEVRPDQHEHRDITYTNQLEFCECGWALVTCVECGVFSECCPCGSHHAPECPWPL
jgi:hypothetical protein